MRRRGAIPPTTLQLMFLVADAPPHVERQVNGYDESIRSAVSRGIKIFPVASSESDDQAEAVFRQIAQATGARFVFLSYGAGGLRPARRPTSTSTDYEELALDDLVVRLVAEEVAALTGDAGSRAPASPDDDHDPTSSERMVDTTRPRSGAGSAQASSRARRSPARGRRP